MKPTLFVDIKSQYDSMNPMAFALKSVATGAEPVEQLVQGDVEADIAITNSIEKALRMTKETENTSIIFAYFGKEEGENARAFASRYPGRVTVIPFIAFEGETEIVPFLQNLINDKTTREAA